MEKQPAKANGLTRGQHQRRLWFRMAVALAVASSLILAGCGTDAPTPDDPAPTPVDVGSGATATPGPDGPENTPDAPSVSFEGQTITIPVGFAPGGGYDTFSRMAAQVLPEYLPGNPSIVVINMPGAGGQRALIETMQAEPDGLTVHIPHTRFMYWDILGTEVPGFTIDSATWLGALGGTPFTSGHYVRREFATSYEEARQKALDRGSPLNDAGTEVGDSKARAGEFLKFLGEPVNVIYGYGGTSEVAAAWDRGELDLTDTASPDFAPRLFPEWIEQKVPYPLFYTETPPEEDPVFMEWMETLDTPVPPHIYDIVDTEQWQRDTYDLVLDLGQLTTRPFVMPPGIPEDIETVWRDAIKSVSEDPLFLELAANAGYDTGYTAPDVMVEGFLDGQGLLEDPRVLELFQIMVGDVN